MTAMEYLHYYTYKAFSAMYVNYVLYLIFYNKSSGQLSAQKIDFTLYNTQWHINFQYLQSKVNNSGEYN